MKLNFWIFLFVGIIIVVLLYLRKEKKLDLAGGIDTGITLPDDPVVDLPDLIPGTDIQVGLKPKPGNGIYQPFPMPMPIPITELMTDFDYLAYREQLKELSPFARRLIERKW